MLSVDKLVHIRHLNNISQNELSAKLGYTRNYISMIENKKQAMPQALYDKWINALYGSYDKRKED